MVSSMPASVMMTMLLSQPTEQKCRYFVQSTYRLSILAERINTIFEAGWLQGISKAPILIMIHSGHDAEDIRRKVTRHGDMDHIIKLHLHRTYTVGKW